MSRKCRVVTATVLRMNYQCDIEYFASSSVYFLFERSMYNTFSAVDSPAFGGCITKLCQNDNGGMLYSHIKAEETMQ